MHQTTELNCDTEKPNIRELISKSMSMYGWHDMFKNEGF
jgi:hypothetical protein